MITSCFAHYSLDLFAIISQVQQVDSCKHHSQLYHSAAMKLLARLQPGYEHYAQDLLSMILFSTEFLA